MVSSSTATSVSDIAKSEAQSIQLEDGTTGFLNQAVKGKYQTLLNQRPSLSS